MLQLNLGSGTKKMVGYINIDKYSAIADLKVDAGELPYDDSTVDKIYSSHMIEHVALSDFKKMLKEWHRVLKRGGILMLRCPNIEAYMKRWLKEDYVFRWGEGLNWFLGISSRGLGYINRNFFTPKRLGQLVREAGFKIKQCRAYQTRSSHMPDGDVLCEATK